MDHDRIVATAREQVGDDVAPLFDCGSAGTLPAG